MWILQSYHYVKEMGVLGENLIDIHYVPTKLNLADLYTKGVPKEVFEFLAPYLCGHTNATSLLKMIKDQGGQSQ